MAITIPTIIQNSSTGVSVEGVNGITYSEILNSLGSNVFRVTKMFLTATSISQIKKPISYSISDANGRMATEVINLMPDPYQKMSTLSKDLSGQQILLNGHSSLSFNLLAGVSLMIQLTSEQYSVADGLNLIKKPNIEMLEGQDIVAGGIGELLSGGGGGEMPLPGKLPVKYINYFWIVVACTLAASLLNFNKGKNIAGGNTR